MTVVDSDKKYIVFFNSDSDNYKKSWCFIKVLKVTSHAGTLNNSIYSHDTCL